MNKNKNAVISIITGTASLCFCWFFWYPGWGILVSFFALALAIVAVISGKKSKKVYKNNSESFEDNQYRNAKLGFNLGVAGLIISSLCIILAIFSTIFFKIQV